MMRRPLMTTRPLAGVAALLLLSASGCARAPSIDILGSFFPIWLFCLLAGIVVTLLLRQLLLRVAGDVDIGPPVLVYTSLVILVACLFWLVFFR